VISGGRFLAAFSGHDNAQADPELFQGIVRTAARMGFALLFIRPDSKEPLCPLTSRTLKLADTAAQDAARESGNPRWDRVRHACGRAHATDDPKVLDSYLKRLAKAGQPMPNLAIDVGRSHMLCIDVDTPAEYQGWRDSWRRHTGTEWDAIGELTVKSPGVYDPATQTWKHHGGGHIWIDLSAVEPDPNRDLLLSVGEGLYKDPSGWTAMYRDKYVLVPPSTRDGRGYTFEGTPISANVDWLLGIAANAAAQRESRRIDIATRRAERLEDPSIGLGEAGLIRWSTATTWTELLAAQGWVDTGLVHSCGCPDWTMAPVDDHASPRSATAHEDGCSASGFDNDEGHAPLMIWSDNRPSFLVNVPRAGAKIMTKLQFAAAVARPETRHGEPLNADDIAAGYRAHGLASDGAALSPLNVPLTPDSVPAPPVSQEQIQAALAPPVTAPVATPSPTPDLGEPPLARSIATPLQGPVTMLGTLGCAPSAPLRNPNRIVPNPPTGRESVSVLDYLVTAATIAARPKAPPLIPGVLDMGKLARVVGPSGAGKTFVATDMAMSVAAGIPWADFECVGWGQVLYVAPEDPEGVAERMLGWCRDKGFGPEETAEILARCPILEYGLLQAGTEGWEQTVQIVSALKPAMIVLDTQAQLSSQEFEENSNREMARFVNEVRRLRDASGACTVLIHHTPKSGDTARGASSVTASMDLEYLVTSDKDRTSAPTISIRNTKAKNRAEWAEPRECWLAPVGDTAVLSFDPTRRPVAPAPPPPTAEESLMTSARQRALLAELSGPLAGMTRSQALKSLQEHGAGGHRVSVRAWGYDFDALFELGALTDTHGTRYVKTPADVPPPGPGTEDVKVYDKSMPLHVAFVPEPESPSTEDTSPPIPLPAPGPGPEV
jgi:hypothetical protein